MSIAFGTTWNPADYSTFGAFVARGGEGVLATAGVRKNERVLDLGCGDGILTKQLADASDYVVGVDSSPEMVQSAQAKGLRAREMRLEDLELGEMFDVAFSNAVLHWVDRRRAFPRIAAHLVAGGRFVGEFGGHGNIASFVTAMFAVALGLGLAAKSPWSFPSAATLQAELEAAGFVVDKIEVFARPTPLSGPPSQWMRTFAASVIEQVPAALQAEYLRRIDAAVTAALYDATAGCILADYVRIRFIAHLPVE